MPCNGLLGGEVGQQEVVVWLHCQGGDLLYA